MSNHRIPPEICDHIIDFLQDNPETLKQCCLVSKSWVSRTREHLFAVVMFRTPDDLEVWKKIFPDPSNSPAHHTHTLSVKCLKAITAVDAANGGWIPTFSCVASLKTFSPPRDNLGMTNLAPFSKFSPTLKSLSVILCSFIPSQAIDLIYYFPLLEDLTLIGNNSVFEEPQAVSSSATSPPLTGTLELRLAPGFARMVNRLLDLPNGLHFQKLTLAPSKEEGLPPVGKLVEVCSETLEHLDVSHQPQCCPGLVPTPGHLDLSKATNLKVVVFDCGFLAIGWVTEALKTVAKHGNLQGISIRAPSPFGGCSVYSHREIIRMEEISPQWSLLDLFLVQFWESRSICAKILYSPSGPEDGGVGVVEWSAHLLPESTKRGVIDLVEEPYDFDHYH